MRQRILVDIETVEQARKIEETVKSGYLDATIEHLLQWIAVEEDLISSYRLLEGKAAAGGQKEMFASFAATSESNLKKLNAFLAECETMAAERDQRLGKLTSLESGKKQ